MSEQTTLLVLHGPNLNLLGEREPHIYGSATLDDYLAAVAAAASPYGMAGESFQSNHEGDLVDAIEVLAERHIGGAPVVKGDRTVDYGAVVRVMDLLKKAGAPTVGLITDQAAVAPARSKPERR